VSQTGVRASATRLLCWRMRLALAGGDAPACRRVRAALAAANPNAPDCRLGARGRFHAALQLHREPERRGLRAERKRRRKRLVVRQPGFLALDRGHVGQRWGNTPCESQRSSHNSPTGRNCGFPRISLAPASAKKLIDAPHNPKVAGSNPAPATTKITLARGFSCLTAGVQWTRGSNWGESRQSRGRKWHVERPGKSPPSTRWVSSSGMVGSRSRRSSTRSTADC
jgi:hypothetical protein